MSSSGRCWSCLQPEDEQAEAGGQQYETRRKGETGPWDVRDQHDQEPEPHQEDATQCHAE